MSRPGARTLCLPVALLLFPGGGGDPPPVLVELPRSLSPSESRIVAGANRFTFDLEREAVRTLIPDSNLVLSPLSAAMALALALNGRGRGDLDGHARRAPPRRNG